MNLSPNIEKVRYDRREDDEDAKEVMEYEYDDINHDKIEGCDRARLLDDEWIVYYSDIGEIYVKGNHIHVKESVYRNMNMVLLRESVASALSDMDSCGMIEGLRKV